MKTNKIPIVFAFDDNYALPASIAIASLIENKLPSTQYEIIIFHDGLKKKVKNLMESICPIRWIKLEKNIFKNAPITSSWPKSVYYRLLIADLLPEYDKIIWSDVDVLFCNDLSNIYNMELNNADWAGVIAERADDRNGIHSHFPENKKKFIYMSGFMVVNAKQWRNKKMFQRFMHTIDKYKESLRMFDLEVLNLSCDKIAPVPFEYCVLENIYANEDITKAKEYPWLKNVYAHEILEKAKKNPVIIHYAGKSPKIWLRSYDDIPQYYWHYIEQSPFYNPELYHPNWFTYIKNFILWILIKICPVKKWRKRLKNNLIYKKIK